MASMSLIGVLLNQTDKFIVGKLTTLTIFSYYSVAVALASLPITLSGAIGSALFPRFTELVSLLDRTKLVQVYRRTCELIGSIVVPAGLVLVFFSGEFIFAWTGSKLIGEQAGLTASLLLTGQLLQSITVIPYNLAMAHGSVRFSQKIGLYSIILITPLMVYLTMKFGIVGAGVSWLLLNSFTLPINLYFLHQQELAGRQMLKDCLRGAIRPLIYSLPCIILGKWLLPNTCSRLEVVAEMGLIWFVAFLISFISFPDIRSFFVFEVRSLLSGSANK
jgi:O-antigen/teichoic acid export membrane protein